MSEIRYPMKMVTQRTGLSSHVVRVWERRYEAVKPDRSGSNRRLYSAEEVHRLSLLAELTRNGHSISQIAQLPEGVLEEMVDGLRPAGEIQLSDPAGEILAGRPENEDLASIFLAQAIAAAEGLDACALEDVFDEATLKIGGSQAIENVIVPLIALLGERWDGGSISIAQEHAASAVIKEILFRAGRPHSDSRGAPDLVVATPAGQLHELGAALVACVARQRGWSVTYLGPSLPAGELARVARLKNSYAVALSIVYPGDDAELPADLRRLRHLLPRSCDILAGGRSSPAYSATLEEIGATHLSDLAALKQWLDEARASPHFS